MPYYFTLPIYANLTDAQKAVLDEIKPVAITGGPGTGKSIVSLWRHIRNHSIGRKKSVILTYAKTLQTYLAKCAATENANAGQSVLRTYEWSPSFRSSFDEIIIDEAQDVGEDKYNLLKHYSKAISYGADDQQMLYPEHCSTQDQLSKLFPKNEIYELDQNFRNSYEVMQFTSAALPNKLISGVTMQELKANRSSGIKPKCIVTGYDSKKVQKVILDIIKEFQSETHNIGILLPLQRHVDQCYAMLKSAKINCTRYFHDGNEIGEIENVHVTTFKSAKGIEFDTVILPDFQRWKSNIASLNVVDEKDYYVAFTRAKRNLYLISATNSIQIHPDTFETIKA